MAEDVGIKRCVPLGLREDISESTPHFPPYDFVPVSNVHSSVARPSDENVFLFYPNLLGYVRILLALGALYAMSSGGKPWVAALLYFSSALLDAFDGYLARKFNQSSRFGAMLDQLTDRLTFLGVLMTLCHFYPSKMLFFQIVAFLDIAAHWMHLHATDLTGKETHKSSSNPILNVYYTSRPCLFWMCFGNEAFYGLLFMNHFWAGPGLFGIHLVPLLAFVVCPIALAKSAINVLHLLTASKTVAEHDRTQRGRLSKHCMKAAGEKKKI